MKMIKRRLRGASEQKHKPWRGLFGGLPINPSTLESPLALSASTYQGHEIPSMRRLWEVA